MAYIIVTFNKKVRPERLELIDIFKVQSLEIKAGDSDVKNFVVLELEKLRIQKISHGLKLKIIEKVTYEVNGMYVTPKSSKN
jgi:hypothetical protein